jgi:hypothetical protein
MVTDIEPVADLLAVALGVVIGACRFEELKGADDVCLDKLTRAMDRAIHMGFR